jgi:hypothetical protein
VAKRNLISGKSAVRTRSARSNGGPAALRFAPANRLAIKVRLLKTASRDLACACRAFLTGLLLFTGIISSTLAVEVDDARLSRTAPGLAQWRWENLEKAPQWICGARPKYNLKERLDVIELAPGESTTFRVPQRGAIRVVRLDGKLAAGDLQIWVSNGSGLYRHLLSGIHEKDGSVIAVPDASGISLARVVRAKTCDGPLRVAIFTSRLLVPEFIDGYWCELDGCGEPHQLSDTRMGPRVSTKYFGVARQQSAQVTVQGPVRLELATRFVYSDQPSEVLQPYTVHVQGADIPRRIFEFDTTSEQRMHVHVDGCERLVGSRELAFLDVPAGEQTIEFNASSPLLMQARVLSCDMYCDAKHNSPRYFPRLQRSANRPETYGSIWQIPQTDVARFLRFDPTDAVAQAGLALRSVRDNRYRQGGLRAAMTMLAAAAGRPSEPTVRRFADHLLSQRTVYRDLLPQWQDRGVIPRPAFFNVRSLRPPRHSHIDVIVGEQLVADAVSRLSSGKFLPVGSCWANAGFYSLPHDLGPSRLRVAVDKSSLGASTRLHLQYDERDPILLDASPGSELKLGQFNPTRGETALAAMNHLHAPFDSGTLGGPFAVHNEPAPLLATGTAELLIPPGVQSVRVWATGDLAKRPRVALQYRTSKTYRLTEPAYLDAVARTGLSPEVLLDALLHDLEPASHDSYAFQEVRNHWVPLVRMLRQFHAKVKSELALPPKGQMQLPDGVASPAELETAATARQLAAHGQWMPALETWATLVKSPQESLRREAILQRAKSLEMLHEVSLAKNELLGVFFHEQQDLLLKQLAYDALLELLIRQEDLVSLERFAAAAYVEFAQPEYLYDLADAFLAKGRFSQAMLVGLMTPDPTRIHETILRSAYQEGWWQTFDAQAGKLSPQQAHLWGGLKQLKMGKLPMAKQQLAAAGMPGQAWLDHLQIGESILNKLSETDATERACAVHAWEAWQAHHPGPRTWREEGALVAECPGTASVYSVGRDVFGQFYAADPGNPLRLIVHGPVDLKFEVRPVHAAGAVDPQDDWLSIESAEGASIVPITANRIDAGYELVGAADLAVGKPVKALFRVGPGRHEVSLAAEHARAFVRVFAARPEMPLAVLPRINEATMTAIAEGYFRRPLMSKFHWKQNRIHPRHNMVAHLLPVGCNESIHLPFVQFGPFTTDAASPEWEQGATCSSGCSLCGQIAESYAVEPDCGSVGTGCTAPVATTDGQSIDPLLTSPGWTDYDESPWRIQMQHVAAGDIQGVLQVPCGDDLMAVRQRMAVLVYLAENNLQQFSKCYAEATRLMVAYPHCPALSGMRMRMARSAAWKLVREFDGGAGIHTLEISEWLPELPSLRVRRAMLGMEPSGDALLTGSQQLVLDVRNTEASEFTFLLKRPAIGYLVDGPMRVVCQVNGRPEQTFDLMEAGAEEQVTVKLQAGEHRVTLWHAEPLLNQFTLVTVVENSHRSSTSPSYAVSPVSKRNRLYQVATHDEPIRFRIPGPATIRIDELRGTRTFSAIELVEGGGREFELRPLDGQEMALFRIWEMQTDASRTRLTAQHIDWQPEPLPTGWLESSLQNVGGHWPLYEGNEENSDWFAPGGFVPGSQAWGDALSLTSLAAPDGKASWLNLDDRWKLGQEDGTTAFHFAKFNRRALEEADRVGLPDKFTEIGSTHYQYDPWTNKYWKTERLSRNREKGGKTRGIAATSHFTLPPRWTWVPRQFQGLWGSRDPYVKRYPVNVWWTAKAFVQQTESVVPRLDDGLEWSAFWNGAMSRRCQLACDLYHTPTVSLYRRLMSMDFNNYAPGEIDQDVFTEFKNDHRFGYVFRDRLVWQPCLDRKWWVEPSFYSNEDFRLDRPDHMSVRIGHSRLAGPLFLDASYRYARYFQDSDRDEYATQHLLYLQSTLGGWLNSGNRVELNSGISHDVTGERTSAYMNLTWYYSRGRGAWDFHPSDMPFLALQKQNAIPAWFHGGGFGDN